MRRFAGRSHASIGILDAGFSCFYYFIGFTGRIHASIGILDAGFHSSIISLALFLGRLLEDSYIHRDLGCGTSYFDYFIGSISGKRLGDAGCAFWCCTSVSFWIEGLSCVLFISGGKAWRCGMCILVRGRRSRLDSWIESYGFVGKVSSGMGMLLSMDNCPCELSRAGRSFEIYTVVTWGFCNFVHFTFLTQTLYPKSKSTASLSCCPFVVITLTWYTYHRLTFGCRG